jgi:indolepyruvate ferredoxin oxidoreductase alpha subunit
MAGADAVVTMKIPGLFQAADVVASAAGSTAERGGLVLYVASDFVPSSTQYVTDPRYFLKSCFLPILEPRTHQEMMQFGPLAADLAREHHTPVVVLANGLLCHSEGLITLAPTRTVPKLEHGDFKRFMNLPAIARRSYDTIVSTRLPALLRFAETSSLNRIEYNDRSVGVITHGITEQYLREVWNRLPIKPSILSLATTYPVPEALIRQFAANISGPLIVLGDGLRFVQEEVASLGLPVEGKQALDSTTEWTPDEIARRLGAQPRTASIPAVVAPPNRPPNICAGCPYRAFGLVVQHLRKKKKIVTSFGDIGCNTLLYFLDAIDTCACMGASDSQRQGAVLARPELAGCTLSVIGDSTECHSGLDSTRNALFRRVPGVKVVLDNQTTAMTGGQPAPSSPCNLAGQPNPFRLADALRAEGATVHEIDAFDMKAIDKSLRKALQDAKEGAFTVLVLQGACVQELPASKRVPRYALVTDKCKQCDLCLVCPGMEKDDEGFPRFTHLCSGCGGNTGVCVQRCHLDAIVDREDGQVAKVRPELPPLPDLSLPLQAPTDLPSSIRVAVRGVGGQGNLFLGKVLAEVALLAGYRTVIKGETHGMAQLGGAVLSTFACGDVHTAVLPTGSVDVLVALEQSEVLRPGFLDLLAPGGTVLLNRLRIVPAGIEPEQYPAEERIHGHLGHRKVVVFDALSEATALGDEQGRTSNVVALGVLSMVAPLSRLPLALWHRALVRVSPKEMLQRANLAAFDRGRQAAERIMTSEGARS